MSKAGFNLIELSIVVLLVALLATAVLFGGNLKEAAKVRKIINELDYIQSSIVIFNNNYNELPGDMSSASNYWSSAYNGDGNGEIEYEDGSAGTGRSETGVLFSHMKSADIIDGDYQTGNSLSARPDLGFKSFYDINARYILTNYTPANPRFSPVDRNHIAGNKINVIRYGSYIISPNRTNTHVGNGIVGVKMVKAIDSKIDDGIARSGRFSGHNPFNVNLSKNDTNSEGCLIFPSGASTSDATGSASYNLNSEYFCNFSYDLEIN
ncbi:MAG: prepilin-type N-terminal cleavage/methylation domain-containing protein [Rickettsiales bacterium]|nr:prepilin-type N-terminal cleavage/methylation domain-containing protein [Rickettsiales bacterium]